MLNTVRTVDWLLAKIEVVELFGSYLAFPHEVQGLEETAYQPEPVSKTTSAFDA